VDDAIADIAAVFHWPLSDFQEMSLDELTAWRARALARRPPIEGSEP
jgi:glutathione S-transferase